MATEKTSITRIKLLFDTNVPWQNIAVATGILLPNLNFVTLGRESY